jgi:diacylglycerol O-acyltransferase
VEDPAVCLQQINREMKSLKESGQAVGAQALVNLAGFAPPTILSQAARLQARQRFFNLVVTNVPGPQFPLYVLGRRLQVLYPVVPLARRQALGIAVMSYDGHLGFGLLADYDALPGLEGIARDLRLSIASLARVAGFPAKRSKAPIKSGRANAAGGSGSNGAKRARKAAGSSAGNGRASLAKPPVVQS